MTVINRLTNSQLFDYMTVCAPFETGVSLFTGRTGLSLAYLIHGKANDSVKSYNSGIELLSEVFEDISQKKYIDQKREIPVIGCLISYLEANELCEADLGTSLTDIDDFLIKNWKEIDFVRYGDHYFFYSLYYIATRLPSASESIKRSELTATFSQLFLQLLNLINLIDESYNSPNSSHLNNQRDLEFFYNISLLHDYLTLSNSTLNFANILKKYLRPRNLFDNLRRTKKLPIYSKLLLSFLNIDSFSSIQFNSALKLSTSRKYMLLFSIKYLYNDPKYMKLFNILTKDTKKLKYNGYKGSTPMNVGLLNGLAGDYILSLPEGLVNFQLLVNLFSIAAISSLGVNNL